jgi:hypothetical protein
VLAKNNFTLIGPSAVSAVEFEHPGFNLYPMEPPEGGDAEAEAAEQAPCGGKTQTLAAFLSDVVLGDGENECNEKGEDVGKKSRVVHCTLLSTAQQCWWFKNVGCGVMTVLSSEKLSCTVDTPSHRGTVTAILPNYHS